MPTTRVKLTNTPQKISAENLPAYVQSHSLPFLFAFSAVQPTDLSAYHMGMKIYTDGALGAMWVWLPHDNEAYVSVSA